MSLSRTSLWSGKYKTFHTILQSAFQCYFPTPTKYKEVLQRSDSPSEQIESEENSHAAQSLTDASWKTMIPDFHQHQLHEELKRMRKYVISIGDSEAERFAAWAVTEEMQNTILKSVKFVPNPSIEALISQIVVLRDNFAQIFKTEDPCDWTVQLS